MRAIGKKPLIFSCGGGVQSAGIAGLIVQGIIPRESIALAVISDTGREPESTWAYLRDYIQPALDTVNLKVHIIPHSFTGEGYNYVDLFGGKDGKTLLIPAHSNQPQDGIPSKSMLRGFCSNEWKRDPVRRYLRKEHGIKRADMMIGFSTDEPQRLKVYDPSKPWGQVYPLWELRKSRADCYSITEQMGWPPPPKSSCWMCPYKSPTEWRSLSKKDFGKAVQFEKEIQAKKDRHVWLHNSCQPLDTVDFSREPDLFDEMPCDSGYCFT